MLKSIVVREEKERIMSKVLRISLAVMLVTVICSPLLGRSIPGAVNEVADPWFENASSWNPDYGWYVEPDFQSGGEYPTITSPNSGNLSRALKFP